MRKIWKNIILAIMFLPEDAKAIYKFGFWDKSGGDLINNPDIRYLMFDFTVNSGRAIFVIQKVLKNSGNDIIIDGQMGSKTINLINSQDPYKFYNDLLETRRQYFYSLAKILNQAGFLDGWLERLKINFKELSKENKTNIKCN